MPSGHPPSHSLLQQANAVMDVWLQRLAIFWIPALVGLLTLMAIAFWPSQYADGSGTPVSFRVLEDQTAQLSTQEALNRLVSSSVPAETFRETRLSEAPFWLYFTLGSSPSSPGSTWVDFTSRHATRMACWNASDLTPIGQADRTTTTVTIRAFRAGFALNPQGSNQLLCQIQSVGPGRISVQQLDDDLLYSKEKSYHRTSGLLDGGILMLALFTAIAGFINRNRTHVLFAAWLVVNMRMAALSMGWDHQWLGQSIPTSWMREIRPITLALYYVVTFTLFASLFRQELSRVGFAPFYTLAKWSCAPLLILAIVMPYASFLPVIWVSTGVGVGILVCFLGLILYRTRSKVAIWYAASIGIALFASLYEVVAAALGMKVLIGAVNSVTAALASSLLASMAIAEQMRQAQLQKLAAQAELQHTYKVIPIGLFGLDLQGRFINANPAMLSMVGISPGELDGADWRVVLSDPSWQQLTERTQKQFTAEFEIPITEGLLAGKRFLVQATLAGDKIEGTLQDITEKSQATENLKFLANHDPLTKVLNRRGIERMLARGLAELERGHVMAVAYLDLDRFKLINDLYGHAAGDAVLQTVCQRIQLPLTDRMFLGRVGGDEFLILMTRTTLSQAEMVCKAVIQQLEGSPCQVGDRAFQVRGSIGLIEVAQGMQSKDILSMADRACRMAKKAQGSRMVVFDNRTGVLSEHEAEMQLIERLATHQSIDGLFLEMQPIVSLRTPYASLNFEVLLRMKDEHGKRVPTERLIHAAENAGRMGVIDRWVVSQTLEWLEKHHQQLQNQHFVCLNLSGASLNDERFIEDVFVMLEGHARVASCICLEITESVALHDTTNTRRFIDMVRAVGAKVALDDFGAGYTSFSYLKDLPADLLKIDGSFIVNMNHHPANVAIVEAIVSLAQNLGMKTIAEWAEDHETVETLAEIGVDYVQGFVVAQPQHPDSILSASSGADFIRDTDLKSYLSTLSLNDDTHVDLILGEDLLMTPPASNSPP
jgi:diguanylate cyclase (GGDEF)-like protein/PAS domain S-box-containing protein